MKRVIAVYAAAVVTVGGWMWLRHLGASRSPSTDLPAPTWIQVQEITVPAQPQGIWTWAFDYVAGPAVIKITARDMWSYSPAARCGPDGDLEALISDRNTILAGAPVGALLVKIGGSTAGTGDGMVRVAGTSAVLQIDEKTSGPIFLTINDEVTGLSDNSGHLQVTLSIGRMTARGTGR